MTRSLDRNARLHSRHGALAYQQLGSTVLRVSRDEAAKYYKDLEYFILSYVRTTCIFVNMKYLLLYYLKAKHSK